MLKHIVLAFLFATYPIFADDYDYQSSVNSIRKDIERDDIHAVARRTDFAISKIIERAVNELYDKGFNDEASSINWDYHTHFDGFLTQLVANDVRDIGDHTGLSLWLSIAYAVIEAKLGVNACKALHISDIKTINYCIPVVFHPCNFPMDAVTIPRKDEYRNHFDKGIVYYGLAPVITYWAVEIGCFAASGGIMCSTWATLAEKSMATVVAPKLSDFVFVKNCQW